MAATAPINISAKGKWLTRDRDDWIVAVPTPGGYQRFNIKTWGSSAKAFMQADKFHKQMVKQLREDQEYAKAHDGQKPKRNPLNVRNTSGKRGVSRMVTPRLEVDDYIQYCATWYDDYGRLNQKCYSNYQFEGDEEKAKKAAFDKRDEMELKYY